MQKKGMRKDRDYTEGGTVTLHNILQKADGVAQETKKSRKRIKRKKR